MLSPVVVVTRSLLAGYTNDNDCMYINGTGQDVYDFYIQVSKKQGTHKNLLKIKQQSLLKRRRIKEKSPVEPLRHPWRQRPQQEGGEEHEADKELHVEHGDHTVQPPHRGGVGRTLQGKTGFSCGLSCLMRRSPANMATISGKPSHFLSWRLSKY